MLILTENETEKDRWVVTLEELHKATKQSPNQMVGDQLLPLANFPASSIDPFWQTLTYPPQCSAATFISSCWSVNDVAEVLTKTMDRFQ